MGPTREQSSEQGGTLVRALGAGIGLYGKLAVESPLARALMRPSPVRRAGFELRLRVSERREEAEGVVGLSLGARDGRELPSWTPGAHLDLVLPSGRVRQYSLCGDPRDRSEYRIAVRRLDEGDGGSLELHRNIAEGTPLTVRGPRNAFRLLPAPEYLFVAGGIGITPIAAMARAASLSGSRWRLVYLGRSEASMPFLEELRALPGGTVEVHRDDTDGFADVAALLSAGSVPDDTYVCGPPPLMDATRELVHLAHPGATVFSEQFSAPPVVGGEPFTVELARSGREVEVAADESALAAIQRELPSVPHSCRQGFCRACRCRVLDGEVEHRDSGTLLDSERDELMLICVSRAAEPGGRLVLDL